MKTTRTFRYNIILNPEPEGGFTVTVPSLPGCVTYGKNLKEAQEMASDAIRAYIASLKKHKEDVPSDNDSFISSVDFAHNAEKKTRAYA